MPRAQACRPGGPFLTGANGTFRFEYLLPGDARSRSKAARRGCACAGRWWEVGKDTQLDFVVGLEVNEAVTVTAASPVVDVKSTEVSFNFKSEHAQCVAARAHRIAACFSWCRASRTIALRPGLPREERGRTIHALLDGANITNPAYGH